MTRVTAVIPNYNHARYLPDRVASVLGQTWPDLEVILMDDCSTDDSRAVIARYASDPRVKVMLNDRNSGSTFAQWNKGVDAATGEYVWLAESDDVADPRLLERVVGKMQQHPGSDMGCCESWLMYGEGAPDNCRLEPHYRPEPRRDLWTGDFVRDGKTICVQDMLTGNAMPNASAVVFRRSLFQAVGGADASMRQSGDRLMWVKMLKETRLAHVGDRLNYYRFHDATVRAKRGASARTITEVYSVVRYIRDHLPLDPERFERALEHYGDHFARASARRGVPLAEMLEACRQVAEIDPKVWRRLMAPWLARRVLGPPRRTARRFLAQLRPAPAEQRQCAC